MPELCPWRAGAGPRLPQPGFVSPFSPPSLSRSLTSTGSILAFPPLAPLLVCGNAPFLWPVHPSALYIEGFPGTGARWPGPTPPPPGARLGDSGESVGPQPTPELGPPALPAPRLAHAKACCVIPTWADIPCPGRSGVGLLIILSAADPRHQPIYCPVSPRWFQEGEGRTHKGGERTVNRRRKAGTSYWHSKKTTEFGVRGRENRNGGLLGSGCLGKPESRGQWDSAQATLAWEITQECKTDTELCNLPAFCRAPTLWTILSCKSHSVQSPKQSDQKSWDSSQDNATQLRKSLLSDICFLGRGELKTYSKYGLMSILEKRRSASGRQGSLACPQPPLQ